MIVDVQLSKYSKALLKMKTVEVKKVRNYSTTAVATNLDVDAYFQILLMSELCDALLRLLTVRVIQEFFANHNLKLQHPDSLQGIIANFMNNSDGFDTISKGAKYGAYAGVGVLAVFTCYVIFQWVAALLAAKIMMTLALTVFAILGFGAMAGILSKLDEVLNDLRFIQNIYRETDPKVVFPKEFAHGLGRKEPCQQSPYELCQGFFARKEGADSSLAEKTFECYQCLT